MLWPQWNAPFDSSWKVPLSVSVSRNAVVPEGPAGLGLGSNLPTLHRVPPASQMRTCLPSGSWNVSGVYLDNQQYQQYQQYQQCEQCECPPIHDHQLPTRDVRC